MPEFTGAELLMDLRNLAVAIAVGFLIGFEREWTHVAEARAHTFAGARTFALIGLAGGLSGLIDDGPILVAAAFLAIAALTITAYWADARDTPGRGGTTEIAIFATFFLGVLAARNYLVIAAVGGVGVAVILSIKSQVEKWAASLSEAEIHAALRFLAISVIILPVLPDQGYGPYDALNPRNIWLMVVFISGLSFLGYWLTKGFGPDHGVFVTGLVGGLASSTATTLSLSKFARDGTADKKAVAAGIIAANVVMLIRVGFLLAAVSRNVLLAIWPVLAAGALAGAVVAFLFWRLAEKEKGKTTILELGNPMEIKPALFFAALLAAIALASAFGADKFGEAGLYVVGLISGLADVDAMTLTAGRQADGGVVTALAAGGAIMLAVVSNIVTKGVMAATIGGRESGVSIAIGFAAATLAGVVTFILMI